ncbi:hypothetical protein P154DRAFT_570995 [Amniculicola lignicola CBS 123094]|uniref:Uncharacterized protein n=1 Tax=Amniculicola lignicola CBS 123094 TaxID=1392246 RepID=A0A6A5X2K8_9PLEO|nr:hypothetical protein P154DRAFT_570995 [Amniculicola lignicola CBS 123094]
MGWPVIGAADITPPHLLPCVAQLYVQLWFTERELPTNIFLIDFKIEVNTSVQLSAFRFLDFPVSIRDQIYTELLVTHLIEGKLMRYQKIPPNAILFVNGQFYVESRYIIYAKNLFVVVNSNCYNLRANPLRRPGQRIPFLHKNERGLINFKAEDVKQCPHFAMTLEIMSTGTSMRDSGYSRTFIISARYLPYLTKRIPDG